MRPEPGFSLYEGRTRGKRIKYTFSDEEDGASDAPTTRRSNRQSGVEAPVEAPGPTFTASGRQVRSRLRGAYGEIMPKEKLITEPSKVDDSVTTETREGQLMPSGRTRQRAQRNGGTVKARSGMHIEGYNALDEMEDETDASSSGAEWDGGDDDDVDDHIVDDEDEEDADMSDDQSSIAEEEEVVAAKISRPRSSLVVALRYQKKDDAPITPTSVSGQDPKAVILDAQQPSLPNMNLLQSKAEELSNEK